MLQWQTRQMTNATEDISETSPYHLSRAGRFYRMVISAKPHKKYKTRNKKHDSGPSLKAITGARAFADTARRCGRWDRRRSAASARRWVQRRTVRRVAKHAGCHCECRKGLCIDVKQWEATRTSDLELLLAYRVEERHADEVRLDQIWSGTKRAAYFEQTPSHVLPSEKRLRTRLLRLPSACHGWSMAPSVVSGILANDLGICSCNSEMMDESTTGKLNTKAMQHTGPTMSVNIEWNSLIYIMRKGENHKIIQCDRS